MNQVLDVQIFRPGAGMLSKGTGTLYLTAHHLIYTYDVPGSADSDGKQKQEEMWVGNIPSKT
jgi:hypothetical protein